METRPEDSEPEGPDELTAALDRPEPDAPHKLTAALNRPEPDGTDELTAALDDLAESAERTSAEQQLLADSARALSEQHRRGWSWPAILAGEDHPPVVGLLASSLHRLRESSSRFRTVVAATLLKEGLSTRQIAARLGVTHQRVSAMLSRSKPGTSVQYPPE
jgi:hypothetical protein